MLSEKSFSMNDSHGVEKNQKALQKRAPRISFQYPP